MNSGEISADHRLTTGPIAPQEPKDFMELDIAQEFGHIVSMREQHAPLVSELESDKTYMRIATAYGLAHTRRYENPLIIEQIDAEISHMGDPVMERFRLAHAIAFSFCSKLIETDAWSNELQIQDSVLDVLPPTFRDKVFGWYKDGLTTYGENSKVILNAAHLMDKWDPENPIELEGIQLFTDEQCQEITEILGPYAELLNRTPDMGKIDEIGKMVRNGK